MENIHQLPAEVQIYILTIILLPLLDCLRDGVDEFMLAFSSLKAQCYISAGILPRVADGMIDAYGCDFKAWISVVKLSVYLEDCKKDLENCLKSGDLTGVGFTLFRMDKGFDSMLLSLVRRDAKLKSMHEFHNGSLKRCTQRLLKAQDFLKNLIKKM
jgi:hypothetical protein